ncbi:MbtH family protein [Streptomyces sp. NBC_00273]|uniref:MbtH family protein n=1 Tax=Streptomyces sp. NBC_00273 TaxID=2903644 RepID=UPI002E28624D|nr:MbtH family NRPS accessory protein [Streptomyces sp. NBC_00273]
MPIGRLPPPPRPAPERPTVHFRPSPEDTVPTTHQVLVNHEGQYALYPATRETPDGWTPAGFDGTEDECAGFVDAQWPDTRPLSLRGA